MAKNNDPILGASDTPVTTENWKAPYEDSWAKNYKTRMDTARKGIGTLGAALVSPVHSVAAGVESLAGFGGNVISAMRTPTAEGHSMDMVAGRTQDVADQLGTVVRPISNSAAVAVQAATGQPIVGNPASTPTEAPPATLGDQSPASAPQQPAPAPAPLVPTGSVLGSVPGATMSVSGTAPITASTGKNADGTSFDNNAAWDGIRSRQAERDNRDAFIARGNEREAEVNRFNAMEKERVANKSIAERINDLHSGNTTWDMKDKDINAMAASSFAADQKQIADRLSATTTQRGQDMALEGVKTTATEAAESRKAVAEQAAQATVLAAREASLAKQSQNKDKQDESDKKDIHDILTNGYGVAPTPQAIQAYRAHQSSLVAWDNNTTKMLAAHTKANPKDGTAIKSALIAYHRDPTNEDAIKGVDKARRLLTGDGAGVEPDWFVQALKMPKLDTAGMQAWKQPQPLLGA